MGSSDLTKEQAVDLFGGKALMVSGAQGLRISASEIYKVRDFWLAAHVRDLIGSGQIIDYRGLKRFLLRGGSKKEYRAVHIGSDCYGILQ